MKLNLRRIAGVLQNFGLKQNDQEIHVSSMSASGEVKELSKAEIQQMVETHARNKAARNAPKP